MRHAKRTDRSQRSIVGDLKDRGVQVIVTNFGQSHPDLLIGDKGKWMLHEVKETDGALDRGQMFFLAHAKGPVDVVTSADEAIASLAAGGLTQRQRDAIAGWLVKNPSQETLSLLKFRKVIG